MGGLVLLLFTFPSMWQSYLTGLNGLSGKGDLRCSNQFARGGFFLPPGESRIPQTITAFDWLERPALNEQSSWIVWVAAVLGGAHALWIAWGQLLGETYCLGAFSGWYL